MDKVGYIQFVLTKSKPRIVDVQRNHLSACHPCEFHDTQSNGAGTHHQNKFAGLYPCATDGVCTDSKRFNERKGIYTQSGSVYQRIRGYRQIFRHAAVDMNTTDPDADTTIGFAGPAGDTISAIEVGDEGNELAFREIRRGV